MSNKVGLRRLALLATTLSGAVLLGACGGGAEDSIPVPTKPAMGTLVGAGPWVIMGSSTAAGVGASPGKKWSDLLQANLATKGAQFMNIAKAGAVTYQGLSSTSSLTPGRPSPDPTSNVDQALSKNPVVLIVAYPTNDTAVGYLVDETVSNIMTIRQAALAKGVQVVVLSTQPRNLLPVQLAQLQQINERLALNIGPCFVDVHTPLSGADQRIRTAYDSGDGVHPNDEGHRVIAEATLAVIGSGRCIRFAG